MIPAYQETAETEPNQIQEHTIPYKGGDVVT
jgi:hypothetical protein